MHHMSTPETNTSFTYVGQSINLDEKLPPKIDAYVCPSAVG